MPPLDVLTVVTVDALSGFACLAVMASAWLRTRRHFSGLGFWLAAFTLYALLNPLFLVRPLLPEVLAVLLTNGLFMAGSWLILLGLQDFYGKPLSWRYPSVLIGVLLGAIGYFIVIDPQLAWRSSLASLGTIGLLAPAVGLLARGISREQRGLARSALIVLAVLVGFNILRIPVALLSVRGNDFFANSALDTWMLALLHVQWIGLSFALVLLVNNNLAARLQQKQRSLEDSEHRFRTLFELSPDGVVVHDSTGIVAVNPAALRLLGVPAGASPLGRPFTDFLAPEEVEAVTLRFTALRAGFGTRDQAPVRLKLWDGARGEADMVTGVVPGSGSAVALQSVLRSLPKARRNEVRS